jgi:hypothetical protein
MVTHSKHDASFAHRIVHLFDGSVVANTVEWKDPLKLNHVIQSEAKNLGNTAQQDVDVHKILRRSAPLDDTKC